MNLRPAPFPVLAALLTLATGSLLWSTRAHALDPPYLGELPSVEKVRADTEGPDHLDSLARRMAVLKHLQRAIEDMARDRRFGKLSADEQRITNDYWGELDRIQKEIDAAFGAPPKVIDPNAPPPSEPSARSKWFSAESKYELDSKLRLATLAGYLSPDTLHNLGDAEAYAAATAEAGHQALQEGLRGGRPQSEWGRMSEQEQTGAISLGVLLLLLSGLLFLRELKTFGIVGDSARDLRAGFARYHIQGVVGVVQNYRKTLERTTTTTTTLFRDGSRHVSVKEDSMEHEAFQLVGKHGTENVAISAANLNFTDGRVLMGVGATRKGTFRWLFFQDRNSSAIKPVLWILRGLFRPRWWPMLPLLGVAFVIGSSTGILEFGPIGSMNDLLRGALAMLLAWPVLLFVFAMIGSNRAKRFLKRDAPRIVAELDKEEAAAGA